jgi:hypothetical protein
MHPPWPSIPEREFLSKALEQSLRLNGRLLQLCTPMLTFGPELGYVECALGKTGWLSSLISFISCHNSISGFWHTSPQKWSNPHPKDCLKVLSPSIQRSRWWHWANMNPVSKQVYSSAANLLTCKTDHQTKKWWLRAVVRDICFWLGLPFLARLFLVW